MWSAGCRSQNEWVSSVSRGEATGLRWGSLSVCLSELGGLRSLAHQAGHMYTGLTRRQRVVFSLTVAGALLRVSDGLGRPRETHTRSCPPEALTDGMNVQVKLSSQKKIFLMNICKGVM